MSLEGQGVPIVHDPLLPPRWRRPLFLAVTALVVVAVVVAAREVMLPFVLALLVAYVLTPLVGWVEARKVPRGVAIVLVYVVVLGTLGVALRLTAPRVAQELRGLRAELPRLALQLRTEWVPAVQARLQGMGLATAPDPEPAAEPPVPVEERPAFVVVPRPDGSLAVEIGAGVGVTSTPKGFVVERLREARDRDDPFDPNRVVAELAQKGIVYARGNAMDLFRLGREVAARVSYAFFVFGITLMLAAYLMLTKERIFAFLFSLARPSSRPSLDRLVARLDRGLSGVVRGQLIICLVNGVLSAIGFALVGLKYWPVLALVATVLSLIPIFGSIVSAVPAVLLGLTQSVGTATFVLVWIVGIHQIEANFLNPKIMGDQAKIHPVLVVFSLLVGEHFFHTVGALLAVPCMSLVQGVFVHLRQIVQESDPELRDEPVLSQPPPPPRSSRRLPAV